jgi:TRAP transporter TAXI family solute receptor
LTGQLIHEVIGVTFDMIARAAPVIRLGLLYLTLSGCTEEKTPPHTDRHVLRMAATNVETLTPAIARLPDVSVQAVTPGGLSVTNLMDLQRGTIDVAIAMADVAYLAFAGQLDEVSEPFSQLRGIAMLNDIPFHFLVGPNARINSIHQLKGARVALGPDGSATVSIAETLLAAYGLTVADVKGERRSYPETVQGLLRGDLGAAFMTLALNSDPVSQATRGGARLLPVDGPEIEGLKQRRPYLRQTLIPARVYFGQATPIRTLAVDLVLLCRVDLNEDIVYRLLEAYFETPPGTAPPMDLERAPATPMPLHPGAARYYRQRQLSR